MVVVALNGNDDAREYQDAHESGDYGTGAARTQESDKSSDDTDEEDDEIAHLPIVTKPGIAWDCAMK